MVAKISVGNSLYGALAYNGQKVNEGEGKLITSNKIFDCGNGQVDIARAMEDFGRYLPARMRTEKPVIHISLNPHPNDKLTDVELEEIARKYMDGLGYGDQPYLVFKHEDIDRHHLHIVSIRVGADGKRLNNDYIHRRSKRLTDALEKEYNLHPASSQRQSQKDPVRKVDVLVGDVKKQVSNAVKALSKSYRFQSMGEYRALLSTYNVTVEEARGEAKGREYHGLVYSATDDKGNKVGNPFKASRIGKSVGYEAIEKRFADSKEQIKEKKLAARTKDIVLATLRQTPNKESFVAALKTKGIDTVLRETDTGRIYGATFIDHQTGCVLNGSRMGKELSANALQEHFSMPSVGNAGSTSGQDYTPFQPSHQAPEAFTQEEDTGGGLGLFMPDAGTDYEEEAFIREMQRKKKKKKGRRI